MAQSGQNQRKDSDHSNSSTSACFSRRPSQTQVPVYNAQTNRLSWQEESVVKGEHGLSKSTSLNLMEFIKHRRLNASANGLIEAGVETAKIPIFRNNIKYVMPGA